MRRPFGIARIVIRPGGSTPEHPQSGLLILGVLANTSALLKPGHVYEIADCGGEALTIKDLGESAIASGKVADGNRLKLTGRRRGDRVVGIER